MYRFTTTKYLLTSLNYSGLIVKVIKKWEYNDNTQTVTLENRKDLNAHKFGEAGKYTETFTLSLADENTKKCMLQVGVFF